MFNVSRIDVFNTGLFGDYYLRRWQVIGTRLIALSSFAPCCSADLCDTHGAGGASRSRHGLCRVQARLLELGSTVRALRFSLGFHEILVFRWNSDLKQYPVQPTGDVLAITASVNALSCSYQTQVALAEQLLAKYTRAPRQYTRVTNTGEQRVAARAVPLTRCCLADVTGNDLLPKSAWTADLQQLMILCNADPLCAGFNSNGWCAIAAAVTAAHFCVHAQVQNDSGIASRCAWR